MSHEAIHTLFVILSETQCSEVSKSQDLKRITNQCPKSELTINSIKVSDSPLIYDSLKWILRYAQYDGVGANLPTIKSFCYFLLSQKVESPSTSSLRGSLSDSENNEAIQKIHL